MAKPMSRREFETGLIVRALKDESFKKRLFTAPRTVLNEELARLGAPPLARGVSFKVLEEDAKHRYLVLPLNPARDAKQELSDQDLDALAGGILGAIM